MLGKVRLGCKMQMCFINSTSEKQKQTCLIMGDQTHIPTTHAIKERKKSHGMCFLKTGKGHKVHEPLTLLLVRHALYLAAILTEQNLSTVISNTVNWDTRHTV